MITPFQRAGISIDKKGYFAILTFLRKYMQEVAPSVAIEPNIISSGRPEPIL